MVAVRKTLLKLHWLSLWTLLVLAPASGVAAVCDEQDLKVLVWLEKMSRSLHESSYHGIVTLQKADGWQSVQVSHVVDGGRAAESLTRLTGQGAEVVRIGHPLHCVHQGHALLRQGREPGECGIASYYRMSMAPGERIAGHHTVLIKAKPRDFFRLGYMLSLDRKTGLLLRSDTFDVDNRLLERFQFTKLSYEERMPAVSDVDVRHVAGHSAPESGARPDSSLRAWAVTWVPDGFAPTDNPAPVDRRRTYTDGLAVFSVFLESSNIQPGEGIVRDGGTLTLSRGMKIDGEAVLVTVIGELPVRAARMVSQSIAWVQ